MKVGIIGSGGREHAICHTLKKSDKVKEMDSLIGEVIDRQKVKNILIDLEIEISIKDFVLLKKIDLVIVGPEKPLVARNCRLLKKPR